MLKDTFCRKYTWYIFAVCTSAGFLAQSYSSEINVTKVVRSKYLVSWGIKPVQSAKILLQPQIIAFKSVNERQLFLSVKRAITI